MAGDWKGIWRRPGARLALGGIAFAVLTAAIAVIAHTRIYLGFAAYDDEGYMLIALRSFLEHGHLYDDVFSQYGPFYYEFWGAIFEAFGIPVAHDGGRMVTTFAWVGTSLLLGLALWRMTRSAVLGLATQILVFSTTITLVNEPMHPGGIICLLLGTIVALSCLVRARTSPLAMAFLGGAVMALILVKINVGAFALIALALVCALSYPRLSRRRWPRAAVELLFVATPLLLVTSKFGEAWARHYAVHVTIAALAVVIVLRARTAARPRDGEELWWLGGGLVVMGLVCCLALIGSGTTPGGLFEGVISQPLRQSDAFSIPVLLSNRAYFFDLFGLVGAGAFFYLARGRGLSGSNPTRVALAAAFSIFIGVEMALSTIGRSVFLDPIGDFFGYEFAFLPFVWVALLPVPGDEDGDTSFARLLLPPLAVLQALHAFPVAGSQVAWSTFLLIPVGALCVANGARTLAGVATNARERRILTGAALACGVVTLVWLVNAQLREPLDEYRAARDGSVALDLPGAEDVRLGPEEVRTFQRVSHAIEANCETLLMLPGMNSFYIWTGLEPPTGYNATAWTTLFDEAHQQRVIDATASVRGLCVLENKEMAGGWSGGAIPDVPLVHYMRRGMRPIVKIDGYRLLRREGAERAS